MSCNFATHTICLLALTMYKYYELQVSNAIQKLSCKAICKTPLFLIAICNNCFGFRRPTSLNPNQFSICFNQNCVGCGFERKLSSKS